MDRDHLGSLLFLSSMAASAACAGGTSSRAPRPNSFGTVGDDDGGASGETWTDPLQTSGSSDSNDSNDSDDSKGWGSTGEWPNEGETGSPTNGGGDGPDIPPDDGGATGSTSGASGVSSGGYDESSTGYDPPAGGDPCPALAQLYSDCVTDYTYESEIDLCQESRANAQAISVACGVAHSEYLACLSTLNCVPLLEPGVPFPCLIQSVATDIACSP